MEQTEEELIGEPVSDVPKRQPDSDCNARRNDGGRFVGYCNRTSGWGTDGDSGRCRTHGGAGGSGGAREGSGAPEDNTNAVRHGAYADENRFYQQVLDDPLRELADEIFADYLDTYESAHGQEPPTGIEMELFRLSVSHVKDVVLDNWASDRPETLESGNPLVEQETEKKFVEGVGPIDHDTYKESVVVQAQKKLSTDRRQWLKDLGLLEDPESQKADAIGNLDFSLTSDEKEGLADAFDTEPET